MRERILTVTGVQHFFGKSWRRANTESRLFTAILIWNGPDMEPRVVLCSCLLHICAGCLFILLKLNIQRCTPIECYTIAPVYKIIIIFDTVVTQKWHFKHEKWLIHQCRHLATFAASPRLLRNQASYVDGRKFENSSFWKIVLLLHSHADVSYTWFVT